MNDFEAEDGDELCSKWSFFYNLSYYVIFRVKNKTEILYRGKT